MFKKYTNCCVGQVYTSVSHALHFAHLLNIFGIEKQLPPGDSFRYF